MYMVKYNQVSSLSGHVNGEDNTFKNSLSAHQLTAQKHSYHSFATFMTSQMIYHRGGEPERAMHC